MNNQFHQAYKQGGIKLLRSKAQTIIEPPIALSIFSVEYDSGSNFLTLGGINLPAGAEVAFFSITSPDFSLLYNFGMTTSIEGGLGQAGSWLFVTNNVVPIGQQATGSLGVFKDSELTIYDCHITIGNY